jgi:hypothetical protein
MADSLTLTVNGCIVQTHHMAAAGRAPRHNYVVTREATGEVLYLAPYRWSSAESALTAGACRVAFSALPFLFPPV